MQMYELEPLMANIHRKHKEGWEQARLIAYVIAQSNSNKKLKPADIIQFAWDNIANDTSISSNDIERLREKAKQYTNTN